MFDQARHFKPVYRNWDEIDVRVAIREIVSDALAAGDPAKLWPAHPMDEGAPDGLGCVYFGGAGIIWALDHLNRRNFGGPIPDFADYLKASLKNNRDWYRQSWYPDHASLLMGTLGILLVQMRVAPKEDLSDRIYAVAAKNTSLPVLELMWGLPGSMLACLHMHRLTSETRFASLFKEQATILVSDMSEEDGVPVWVQSLYGMTKRFLGPVHGYAGNMLPLLLGWDFLTSSQQAIVTDAVPRTLARSALQSPDGVTWPPAIPLADHPSPPLCQHCHGAPGMVTSLAAAPFSTPEFEGLLAAGGLMTWHAGPLAKGSNLCHGTGGNGYAFLKMFKRTGDAIWLQRARSFAMVGIDQCRTARAEYRRGRYSLWTGDVGLAVYLADCIDGSAGFPMVDLV